MYFVVLEASSVRQSKSEMIAVPIGCHGPVAHNNSFKPKPLRGSSLFRRQAATQLRRGLDVLRKALSLCGFLVAAAAIVGLFAIQHLLANAPTLLVIQACAVLLMLWARATFGLRSFHPTADTTEGGLVSTGPYRYWRHPIYASIIYFVWTGQVEAPTRLSVALALLVTAGLALRMVLEEQFLVAAYPEYSGYMRHAKRLVPFIF